MVQPRLAGPRALAIGGVKVRSALAVVLSMWPARPLRYSHRPVFRPIDWPGPIEI